VQGPYAMCCMQEDTYTLQVTGVWDRDPQAEAAIPAADFARIVQASRGAHCRPLHPQLASLCSAPKAACGTESAAWQTEPESPTAAAIQQNPAFDSPYLRRTFRDGIAVI
jgi:hypothetical protein